jgi:hypothetical protein
MKQIDDADHVNNKLSSSPTIDHAREDAIKGNDDQLPKSHSTLEVDQRRKLKGPQTSSTNYEFSQKSCPNLSVSPQSRDMTVANSSSHSESREWLVHIDFDPEKRADKDCNKDVQTIKVTTTRINPELRGTSPPRKDNKAQVLKEKLSSPPPASEGKLKTSTKPSSSNQVDEPDEKSSTILSEEDKNSPNSSDLMLKRLLRPTMRSVPPVRPKPNIQHQVSKSRVPVVAWEKTQQSSSSSEVTRSCPTETNIHQTAKKNPPFAMYGVNDNGIRQTYNVGPNSKEVHSSALRAKKERERLQLFRREVEKKKPPMIKQPQVSMKVFCDALCAQNKPREPDAWSTEYKRNFTSCYDFTPKRPVFKPIREFDKQLAVSK